MFDRVIIAEFEKKKDIDKYCEFQKEMLFNVWNEEYENHIRNNFRLNSGEIMYVAIIKNKMVGAVLIKLKHDVCYIQRIDVLEGYRSKNIGTKLVSFLFEKFRGFGFELLVAEDEKRALSFYEKLGFVNVGRQDNSYKMSIDKRERKVA